MPMGAYLKRIEQVLSWAAEQDIWVVIDMHQDEYAPGVGSDGAPQWAVLGTEVKIPNWLEALYAKIKDKLPFSKAVGEFEALYAKIKDKFPFSKAVGEFSSLCTQR